MGKFVYAKQDIPHGEETIRKNEIGIADDTLENKATVSFASNGITIELDSTLVEEFNPANTGDQYAKKVCNMCNRLLDVEMFAKNQNGKNNRTVRRPSCNDCRKIIDGVGMTAAEKKQMNKIKPNMVIWTCPICNKTTIPGLTSKIVCDHNHNTGHPRAWICDSCNTGLGRFKDDTALLRAAITYLESHGK